MTQHSQNGEGVEARAREVLASEISDHVAAAKVGAGVDRLISTKAAIRAMLAFADEARQSLAREPATADVGRLLSVMSNAARRLDVGVDRVSDVAGDLYNAIAETHLSRAAPSSGHAMAEGERADDAWNAKGVGQDELVAGFKRALQHPAGDHDGWTDAGMEDAFFRWPVIVNALNNALATTPPTTNDAIPAGWKLVPIEPTGSDDAVDDGMIYAGGIASGEQEMADRSRAAREVWFAMLSAAPSAPATEAGEEA